MCEFLDKMWIFDPVCRGGILLLSTSDFLSTHHEFADSMSAIVDDQFVIAVNFEVIKSDHESFENGFRLESDHAVHIAFVGRYDHCPIDGLRDIG